MAKPIVGGEGLGREFRSVLLHKGTHGVASTRGIADTSRQGRWHNARRRDLTVVVGVDIARVRSHGWKATTVAGATVARVEIRCLEAAITAFRDTEPHSGRGAAA